MRVHQTNEQWAHNQRERFQCRAVDILAALEEGDKADARSRTKVTAELLGIKFEDCEYMRQLWSKHKARSARLGHNEVSKVEGGGKESPLLGKDLQEFQVMAAHAQKLLDKKARLEEELAAVEKYLVTYEPILQQVKNMREATRKAREASQP